jgi:hypothetical protein
VVQRRFSTAAVLGGGDDEFLQLEVGDGVREADQSMKICAGGQSSLKREAVVMLLSKSQ